MVDNKGDIHEGDSFKSVLFTSDEILYLSSTVHTQSTRWVRYIVFFFELDLLKEHAPNIYLA